MLVSGERDANRPMADPRAWHRRRDGAALGCIVGASVALQLLVYDRWISLPDEGTTLQIADQLNQGSLLYRDAVHVAWPGVFYFTAGLFRVFGTSVLVTRCFMVLAFSLLVALVYVLARGVAGRGPALLAALSAVSYRMWALPHWHVINYSSLAMLLQVAGVTLVASDLKHPRRRRIALAGLLGGLAAVFKQDSGCVFIVGMAAFLWSDDRNARRGRPASTADGRRFESFVLAALAPVAATVLGLAAAGLAGEWFEQTAWLPLVRGKLWAVHATGHEGPYLSFPPLWPLFAQSDAIRHAGFFNYFPPILLDMHWQEIARSGLFRHTVLPEMFVRAVYLAPYVLLVCLGARMLWLARVAPESTTSLRRRRGWLLFVFAAGALLSFNRPRDWVHLMVLYVPTLILVAPAIDALAGRGWGARRRLVMGVAGIAVGVSLASSVAVAVAMHRFYAAPLASPRAGVHVRLDTARLVDSVLDDLRPTTAGAPLAALPYYPMLNFLAERPLATRILAVLPLAEFPDRDEQILADIDRDPRTDVVYALQHLTGVPRVADYAPRLFAGLADRYQLGTVFNHRPEGMIFARLAPRRQTGEEVLYDFAAQLGGARTAVVVDEEAGRAVGRPGPPTVEIWPFESPVLAVQASVAPARTVVTFDVPAFSDARLRFGVAMNPEEWRHFLPATLRFVVRVDERPVFDTELDPRRELGDRRWVWADLPLEAAAATTVSFEASTDNPYGAVGRLAGWARPRIVRVGGGGGGARGP
jgi:hypothetical protein